RLGVPHVGDRNQPLTDQQLEAFADGYWTRPGSGDGGSLRSPIPVGDIAAGDVKHVDAALVKKCYGTMTGTVVASETRLPLAGAAVEGSAVITDSYGNFTLTGVLLGYNNTAIDRGVLVDYPGYGTGTGNVH